MGASNWSWCGAAGRFVGRSARARQVAREHSRPEGAGASFKRRWRQVPSPEQPTSSATAVYGIFGCLRCERSRQSHRRVNASVIRLIRGSATRAADADAPNLPPPPERAIHSLWHTRNTAAAALRASALPSSASRL